MKKSYLFIATIVLVFLVPVSLVSVQYVCAIDSNFQVNMGIVPEDFFPPSIPIGVSSTPISSSQINLAWNASIDDVGVSGYRIFRDSSVIATTSGLSYEDSGLIASTTYSYTVEAFDGTFKYSGQSAVTSTTTFAATVIPPISTTTPIFDITSGKSGSRMLMINDLNVVSTNDSAMISFTTTQPTQAKVFWGTSINYELGSISGFFYGFDHSIKIPGLSPDTQYFFRVEVVNRTGFTVFTEGLFQSQRNYNFSPLANVTHFQAIPQENSIALLWNIPRNRDIDLVRVVKSDKFFPRDISDGEIAFEGYAEKYLDTNVAKDKMYYYAIFARDSKGEYSSGVLAQAKISTGTQISISSTSTDLFIGIPIIENLNSIIRDLTFSDFDFIQDNKRIENTNSIVAVDGSKNLTVVLKYSKVPEILKTIAITLTDPKDPTKIFTFLLRVDKNKTLYEATIAPLGESGKYKVNILVLDYKNQGLKRISGLLNVLVWDGPRELFKNCGIFDEFGNCSSLNARNRWIVFIILLILLLIAIIGYITRRRKDKRDELEDKGE